MPEWSKNVQGGRSWAELLRPRSRRSGSGSVNELWVGEGKFVGAGATGTFTTTDLSGYRYIRFTTNGTMTVTAPGRAQVLVCAGGAGGGNYGGGQGDAGGGGGGGGVRVNTGNTWFTLSFVAGTSTITVGNGGAAGSNGGNSSITYSGGTFSATGGGTGSITGTGYSGGCGGGTAGGTAGTGNAGGYTPVEGYDGGNTGPIGRGSGGGASQAAGYGYGGQGVTVNNIDSNLSTILGFTVIGSGGGGGADCNNGGSQSTGGTGAGNGAYGGNGGNGSTFGGAGGGGTNCFGSGRAGGSGYQGVVVVRYAL